jgi:hypothetical protein
MFFLLKVPYRTCGFTFLEIMLVQGEASHGGMTQKSHTWMNANSGVWQQVHLFWLKDINIYEVGMDSN